MMVSLGIYVRQGRRMFRRWITDPRSHAPVQAAAYAAVGFFLSAASLGNFPQPLTLGLLCALTGWPAVLLAAGGVAGYLTFWGSAGAQGALWLAAGLIAAIAFGSRTGVRQLPLLMCAVSGLIVALSGLAFQLLRGDTTPVLLYLLRVVLAPLACRLFQMATQRRDPVVDWAVCGVAVLALAQVMPIPYFGLGYVAAGILAATGAFPAAALAGLALDLARITPVPMTAVLCLSYLVRLIPGGKRRLLCCACAAVYLPIMGLCSVWDLAPLPGLVCGGLISIFLPPRTEVSRRRGETGFAQVRLELAASVLNQTEQLLSDIPEVPIDEEALIVRAAERACGSCPCRKACKEQPQTMSTTLLHKPLGNGEDLPLSCRKTGRLLLELRRSQEQLRTIRADRDRQQEYRASVLQQYRFLAEYLQDLSDALAQRTTAPQAWYQPELAVCSASRENANGDRCIWFAGTQCRYYVLLCDGMGTGEAAARDGKTVTELLRKMLGAGFPAQYALRSINSLCALQGQAGAVTIDLAELRLDTGRVSLYKWGAAPSYLITHGEPIKIGTASPPPGLSVTEGRETVEQLSLRRGETLILLSDGAGGEEALRRVWVSAAEPPGVLAAKILESSQAEGMDDATVAVVRLGSLPAPV